MTAPDPSESVVIHNFWGQSIVFHARYYAGTVCDPRNRRRRPHCGHALPRRVAEQIARPCGSCYRSDA